VLGRKAEKTATGKGKKSGSGHGVKISEEE
jgi:hypothetical protein